jgi:hypothetical protein
VCSWEGRMESGRQPARYSSSTAALRAVSTKASRRWSIQPADPSSAVRLARASRSPRVEAQGAFIEQSGPSHIVEQGVSVGEVVVEGFVGAVARQQVAIAGHGLFEAAVGVGRVVRTAGHVAIETLGPGREGRAAAAPRARQRETLAAARMTL